jgi:hypothetical protein
MGWRRVSRSDSTPASMRLRRQPSRYTRQIAARPFLAHDLVTARPHNATPALGRISVGRAWQMILSGRPELLLACQSRVPENPPMTERQIWRIPRARGSGPAASAKHSHCCLFSSPDKPRRRRSILNVVLHRPGALFQRPGRRPRSLSLSLSGLNSCYRATPHEPLTCGLRGPRSFHAFHCAGPHVGERVTPILVS